jgi:L-ascorbate metabolism protein UlaG (beta-lactamase superfamily)
MKKAAFVWALFAVALCAQQRVADTIATPKGDLRIVPIRHASLLLQFAGKAIYVDPVGGASYAGLPKADLILITDIHGDHLDLKQIGELKQSGTKIVAPAAVQEKVPEAEVIGNGQATTWEDIRIEALPMYNIERGPKPDVKYHEKGRGNAYLLTIAGKRIYIAGDTECIPEMKALKNIDVAFVPMNLPYTMTPQEAATCVKAFRPRIVYPYHYRGADLKVFENALKDEKGIQVRLRDWY